MSKREDIALKEHENRLDKLEEKNIITARLESIYTIQNTSTAENIKNFKLYNSVGSKLTVENGVIKIRCRGVKSESFISCNDKINSKCNTYYYLFTTQ